MDISKDLVAASATPLILSILEDEESYGYAIIRKVKTLSKDRMGWTEGMLYPVLHRLESQGFVESSWRVSENGRRRKYYRIRPEGRDELQALREQWEMVNATLERSWDRLGRKGERES